MYALNARCSASKVLDDNNRATNLMITKNLHKDIAEIFSMWIHPIILNQVLSCNFYDINIFLHRAILRSFQ
jgi:hypothetical protein